MELPKVTIAVHAHLLKEYLDNAKLDLAIIRPDGSEIIIEEAAFLPRDEVKRIRQPGGSTEMLIPKHPAPAPHEGEKTASAKFLEPGNAKKRGAVSIELNLDTRKAEADVERLKRSIEKVLRDSDRVRKITGQLKKSGG
jgi:hypothetical protein